MQPIKVTLTFEKSTKNKHVFSHPDFGGFYLPKSKFEGNPPSTIQAIFQDSDKEA